MSTCMCPHIMFCSITITKYCSITESSILVLQVIPLKIEDTEIAVQVSLLY